MLSVDDFNHALAYSIEQFEGYYAKVVKELAGFSLSEPYLALFDKAIFKYCEIKLNSLSMFDYTLIVKDYLEPPMWGLIEFDEDSLSLVMHDRGYLGYDRLTWVIYHDVDRCWLKGVLSWRYHTNYRLNKTKARLLSDVETKDELIVLSEGE